MSTDHTSDRTRPLAGPSEELDPWSEFLSESDELSAGERGDARADTGALDLVDRAEPGTSIEGEFSSELPPDLPSVSSSVLSSDLFRPDAYSLFGRHDAPDVADSADSPASSREHLPLPVTLSLAIPSRPERASEPALDPDLPAPSVPPPAHTTATTPAAFDPPARPAVAPGRDERPTVSTVEHPASGSIAVRDLLSRQTPVQWAEAVAVVEALCEVLVRRGSDRVPDSRDILITVEGGVEVRPGAGGDKDPAVLGQLLHALLTTASTPLPLRLFVTSSSASGRYRSIALYGDALSYYAVPGRAAAIAALYQRAFSREPVAPAPAPAVPIARKPAAVEAGTKSRAARVPSWLVAAAVGIVAGVSIGAALIMQVPSRSEPVAPETEVAAESATPATRDDWELGAIDAGTPGPTRRSAPAPASVAPASTSSSRAVSPSPAPRPPSETLAVAPPPPPPPSPASAPAALVATSRIPEPTRPPFVTPGPVLRSQGAALPAIASPRVSDTPVRRPPPPDPRVYSAGDSDVEPPRMLSPAPLAPPPPSPTDTFANSTVELIVDSAGNVQKASLLERPTRLPDVTNLQAYKNLKFSPATKDGQPVSYRYVLRIVAAPR